jgi:hypothetical protein
LHTRGLLVVLLRDLALRVLGRDLGGRRHVEGRERRDDSRAHAELDDRRASRRVFEKLAKPLLGPAPAQIAGVGDGGVGERLDGLAAAAAHLHLLGEVSRDAPHDEHGLVRGKRADLAREHAVDAGPEIDRGAEPDGALRLLEQEQRGARRPERIGDPEGRAAGREPFEDAEIGVLADTDREQSHGARQPREPFAQRGDGELAHGRPTVADVDDRAAARAVELARGFRDHRAEIRRAAAIDPRQTVRDRLAPRRVHRTQCIAARRDGAKCRVARPHGRSIVGTEMGEQRRGHRPGDGQRATVGRCRRVDDDREIEPARRLGSARRPKGHEDVVRLLAGVGSRPIRRQIAHAVVQKL